VRAGLLILNEISFIMLGEVQTCSPNRDSRLFTVARRLWAEVRSWLCLLVCLMTVWGVLVAIPRWERRAADVLGSVWMGPTKIGSGLLVGVQDGSRTHIAFLTARHVATANGFFRQKSMCNAVFLGSPGAFRCRRIGNIAPERWFCSEKPFDFAWFELSAEELRKISSGDEIPPCVMIEGADDAEKVSAAVASFKGDPINSVLEGDVVEVAKTVDIPVLGNGFKVPMLLPSPISLIFTKTERGSILKRWHECSVQLPLNEVLRTLTMRLSVLELPAHRNDSGAPVFIGGKGGEPSTLLGIIISADLKQGMCAFQPFKIDEEIKRSLLSGKGIRLVDKPGFW